MTVGLHRFWFEFEVSRARGSKDLVDTLPWACGVTAYDEADALNQIELLFPGGLKDHVISRRIQDVDMAELAADVVANRNIPVDFGVHVVRGVWYPHVENP